MTKTKWTPGKWEAVETQDGGETYYWVHAPGQSNPVDHEWVIRRKADADLICAAPDLYAALEAALSSLPLGYAATGRAGATDKKNAQLDAVRRLGLEALAKARGEE